jgi:DNA-binding transcriptional LysR family regulator
MDRLQSMRVFAKVVEHGSFSRAGQVLDLSNAVVTRYIADLEEHLRTRLLHRTTRKLSLTESGQAYLERVLPILQEIDDAEALALAQSSSPSGTLRIYCSLWFGHVQLGKLLPEFAAEYPDVLLDVSLSDRAGDLIEDNYDIGIFTDFQRFEPSMIARQLGAAEVVLCASPAYVARHGDLAQLSDFDRHACLNFSYEQMRHILPVLGPDGGTLPVPINARVLSNSGALLLQCALAGTGIMVVPSFALDDNLSTGRLVRIMPTLKLPRLAVTMAYPSRRQLSAKVRAFVEFMAQRFPRPESDPWLSAAIVSVGA